VWTGSNQDDCPVNRYVFMDILWQNMDVIVWNI
jgi:hypothetical protein